MFLENYFSKNSDGITFTRKQGSSFAKEVAGDFNPIHDEDSKRFCVPGDLLFSLVLNNYGISQKMTFNFSGMVGSDITLNLPEHGDTLTIRDTKEKEYLTVERSGDNTQDSQVISDLIRRYVEFSGQAFPHILVPLMADNQVMINTARPLVIYESMSIDLDTVEFNNPELELSKASLDVEGKRGTATLAFNVISNGTIVGRGTKSMVLSGLREFDQQKIDELVSTYNARKEDYQG